MGAPYPDSLPCPQISDYQVEVDHGASAVTFEHGNRRQRSFFKQERNVFSFSLVLTTEQLWDWQLWANVNGYDWHWMELESSYSSVSGSVVSEHYIRYISDIAIEPVDLNYFRVVLQAEMDLNTLPRGIVVQTGNWYVARTPANPATDIIRAGTPASPSVDVIIAGSPGFPAA